MSTVSVLNTDANITAKTLLTAEGTATVTALHTFDRDPNPPFAVSSGSAAVANLDADKVDGVEGTAFARWDGSGTPLGRIAFPAAQSASADANTLDDYEEGTWVPVIGGSGGTSGQTYSIQAGHYVKIGKLVHATFNVTLSAKGTITSLVQIQGLPFTIENLSNYGPACQIGYWGGLVTSYVFIGGFGSVNTTSISLEAATTAAAILGTLATGDLSNTAQFIGSITYRASA